MVWLDQGKLSRAGRFTKAVQRQTGDQSTHTVCRALYQGSTETNRRPVHTHCVPGALPRQYRDKQETSPHTLCAGRFTKAVQRQTGDQSTHTVCRALYQGSTETNRRPVHTHSGLWLRYVRLSCICRGLPSTPPLPSLALCPVHSSS